MEKITKPQKCRKKCVVCGTDYFGYDWRTTCGSEECQNSNKHGIRPYFEQITRDLSVFKEDELMSELTRRGYALDLQSRQTDFTYKINSELFQANTLKFGVVSDTHLCSKYQQLTYLNMFYDMCEEEGIEVVLHGGDLVEGNGRLYKGQEYEMFISGVDNKEDYVVTNYPKRKSIETYLIGGSHDYSFFKENGHDVLESICDCRDDLTTLGYFRGNLTLSVNDNLEFKVKIRHGSGSRGKGRSNPLQGEIDKIPSKLLPDIMIMGHFHYACYIPSYKFVEGFTVPCFQDETPFLAEKYLDPVIGGLIITASLDEELNIWKIKPDFRLFKDGIPNDF